MYSCFKGRKINFSNWKNQEISSVKNNKKKLYVQVKEASG
jgi:hypothetical protein